MFVSDKAFDWFKVSQEAFEYLRQENAALKAERDTLKSETTQLRISSDWLRAKVNQLEIERAGLIRQAYNINVPAPQLVREPEVDPTYNPREFSFDDIGDQVARIMGMPAHGEN